MEQVTINVKTDKKLKAETEEILKEMGLNLTTAINVYFRTIVRKKEIPFKISIKEDDKFYTKEYQNYLYEISKGKDYITKSITELETMENE